MKSSDFLVIGNLYGRERLRSLFDITDAALYNGIFMPKGYESIWIFLTGEKQADRTRYRDYIDGEYVYFDGQLTGKTDRLIIQSKADGNELLLFYRPSKYAYGRDAGAAFRYYGPIEYVTHEGSRPTRFTARFVRDVSQDALDIDALEAETYVEGGSGKQYVNVYERNPELRRAAIRLHGTKCLACGFDFEEVYGERGRGFIEVHHLRPVSTLTSPAAVDPRTDLVVLCANCHRMVHRRRDRILGLEELRRILRKR